MFTDRVRLLRKSRGINKKQMSELLQLPYTTYNNYETGTREPNSDVLIKIANKFNVSVDFLLGNTEPCAYNSIPVQSMLPIIGSIPAGIPVMAIENIIGYYPSLVPNDGEHFYLRVKGDSMIGAGIKDNCLVLIKKQSTADNGQIVACRINGDEATLKKFKRDGNVVLLMPENSDYETKILTMQDFDTGEAEIIGVAKSVVSEL